MELGNDLTSAIERTRHAPDSDDAWERLERLASENGKVDAVSALYREILATALAPAAALRIGERAMRFHDEWPGDDGDTLIHILDRVLELEPAASWAFERLVLALTVAGRWDDLFARFDRAVAHARGADRRRLLEEAVQTAREVAGAPERAIPYLVELQRLAPSDGSLSDATERALERNQQWGELVRLWHERVEISPPAEGNRLREKMAALHVEKLDQPAEALAQLRHLVSDGEDDDREAVRLLESILANAAFAPKVRGGALELLRGRHERRQQPGEVVRVLGAALAFADPAETIALHREIAQRLDAAGAPSEAITHFATTLALDPHAADARAELRRLAALTGEPARLAAALVTAADACRDALRVDLLVEAANLADDAGAIELHRRVLEDPLADAATRLSTARRLNELYDRAGRGPERLAILERLASIEPITTDRRGALGQAARLATTLGDTTRAIALWNQRLEADANDPEALAGQIAIFEAEKRWSELGAALRRRIDRGAAAHQIRADLIQLARLQGRELERRDAAIATWRELRDRQGDDAEITDALAGLYEEGGAWGELAELLEGATARDAGRTIDAGARLGDLYREKLNEPARAAAAYDRTLRLAPEHAAARAGLIALIATRLETAADRAAVLEQQARMEEETGAPDAARRSVGSALVLAPDRLRLESELLRLAAATTGWDDAATSMERAAAVADEARAAELRFRAGGLRETRLADAPRALEDYRLAAIGGHAGAASALARVARALGPSSVGSVEAVLQASEARAGGDTTGQLQEVLVELRRPAGGAPLAAALHRVQARRPDDLDLLREIAELSGGEADAQRLLDEASRRLGRAPDDARAAGHAMWAVDALGRLLGGKPAVASQVLAAGSRLPIDTAEAQKLRRGAAAAALAAGDRRRATELYREAIERDATDLAAIRALIPLLQGDARMPELLGLRRAELASVQDPAERMALRLEVAKLAGRIEEKSDRVPMLLANLEEEPGHDASIDALADVLAMRRQHARLAELLAEQATRVGQGPRAARLWERAAKVFEEKLNNGAGAIDALRRAAAQDPTPATFESLARLCGVRGEHAAAATWIERRLAQAGDDPELVQRLARAHLDAGQRKKAIAVLEGSAGRSRANTDLLLELYRAEGAWDPLGQRLVELCGATDDPVALVAYAREASDVLGGKLGAPDRAVAALERAARTAPDDRDLQISLAEALGAAGKYTDARKIFEELLAEKSRRRSSERAELHRRYAAVARAGGDADMAIAQLDLAAKLDMARPSLLAMLAAVARDAGKLDQAERAYRALLLLVRRRGVEDPETPLPAEILYELGRIAAARGDERQERELTEAALESAVQGLGGNAGATQPDGERGPSSWAEARGLLRTLIARSDGTLALRLADACLASAEGPIERAEGHAARARALAVLRRPDEALTAWLAGIAEAPGEVELLRAAEALAVAEGRLPAYVEGASALLARRRRRADWQAHAGLVLQVARIVEEQGDPRRATTVYRQLAEHGERVIESWAQVVRLAGVLGDADLSREALTALATVAGAASADLKADSLYQVAELQLSRPETQREGFATLSRAVDLEPRPDLAARLLGIADAGRPLDDEQFARYAEVAASSGDPQTLLTFYERRARRPGATLAQDREAATLAMRLDEHARAEVLLAGAVDRARSDGGGLGGATWALYALIERGVAARDARRAIAWLREAAQVAEHDRLRTLGLELARAVAAGDPAAAAETYRFLLELDPGDREAWQPLLELYRQLNDGAAARELAERLIATLMQPAERNLVRMSLVAQLVSEGRLDEAVTCLQDVIYDEPAHVAGTLQLMDLFEKTGRTEELNELLARQLDEARERGDRELSVSLALRLGSSAASPEDAAATYRGALEVANDDARLLRALAGCIEPARDGAAARAEVLERLLAVADASEAPAVALELAGLLQPLGERARVERALAAGRRAAPAHVELRQRLEALYRHHDDHAKLAALLEATAEEIGDPARAVEMLREAAEIHRDFLLEVGPAAACLARARQFMPDDVSLVTDHVATLLIAGDTQGAVVEVGRALQAPNLPREARGALLRQRAELSRSAGDLDAAIADLEEVVAQVGDGARTDLATALEQKLAAGGEHATFTRLTALLEQADATDRLRDALSRWLSSHPDDVDALGRLLALETREGRWRAVVSVASELFKRERGEARLDRALVAAEAALNADDPGAAIPVLRDARREAPDDRRLVEALERVFVVAGENAELARLLTEEASRATDPSARALLLLRIGELHLGELDDPAAAIEPLTQAAALRGGDLDVTVLLSEAMARAGEHAGARKLLEAPLAEQKKKRTPKVPVILRQMARLAELSGDRNAQLATLQEAYDADRRNGQTAADLGHLARELGKYDVALKMFRAISLLDDPAPMTRGLAFYEQARVALLLGNPGQAELWAKKALTYDAKLAQATELLASIAGTKRT